MNKSGIHSFIFCLFVLSINFLINFLLVPLSSLQKKFNSFHSVQENIDCIVIGSSLEGDGINADIIKAQTGMNAFIFAPQGGYPESSYYLLLDVLQHNKVKTAVISWDILQNLQYPYYEYPHKEEFTRSLLHDSVFCSTLQKIMLKKLLLQNYTASIFKFFPFKDSYKQIPKIIKSRSKSNLSIKTIHTLKPIDVCTRNFKKKFSYNKVFSRTYTDSINPDDIRYYKKIIEVCQKKGISLYIICCPLPDCVIQGMPQLPLLIASSQNLFKSLTVPFINGFDQTIFPGSTLNTNFKDCFGHIISPYRELYTKQICNYIQHTRK
jgi:hypothetical protein